jgi:hypothetical protein
MAKQPPIVFWATKDRQSFKMRGRQVADALAARGYVTELRTGPARKVLADVRDSIVVCVKNRPRVLLGLRRRGNRVVFDAIDFQPLLGLPWGVDAIIAGTEEMRLRFARLTFGRVRVCTIYHHADPGLAPHRTGEDALRLVYVGEPENSRFIDGDLPELARVDFKHDGWREQLRDYNAHFSARLDRNKAVIKLANAAALGAVFLTGPEPGCVELLGTDYPFFLRDYRRLAAVREDVRCLAEAVGGVAWYEARDRIEAARDRLTIAATAQAYDELIVSL